MGVERLCLNTAVVLLIIVLCCVSNSECTKNDTDYVKIAKCCPQGSELELVDESADYQCTSTEVDGESNRTFFGYNLEIYDESQLPNCTNVKLIDLDVDGGVIYNNGCVDMYNGVLYGLTCSGEFPIEIRKLFKCCAEGRTVWNLQ